MLLLKASWFFFVEGESKWFIATNKKQVLIGNSQGHNQQFWPMHVATFYNNDHCIHCHWCVCGEIDGKFELLVNDETSPKDNSNYGYIYITLLSFIALYHHIFSKNSSTFVIGVGEVCCHIPSWISLLWLNNSTKEPPHFASWKILRPITMVMWGC